MRQLLAISAAALLWSAATAFAAGPVGKYRVEGTNPGGGSEYSGTVSVEKTGQTYRVIWIVGGTRYVGTGIGDTTISSPYPTNPATIPGLRFMAPTAATGPASGPIPAPARWAPKSGSANNWSLLTRARMDLDANRSLIAAALGRIPGRAATSLPLSPHGRAGQARAG